MKPSISALVIALAMTAAAASAQPSGGPDAKGNAPLKASHTVNDGAPKAGANSFTEGQARQHITTAGFSNVSGLVKGGDGVWRGQALKDGATIDVAMDFKGNVTTAAAGPTNGAEANPDAGSEATNAGAARSRHIRHRHHHHGHSRCAAAKQAGAACSGVDTNGNGISDKEDRASSH